MNCLPVPPVITIAPLAVDDAGELLTLQRAAYATEARIYGDPDLPAMTQTLEELRRELGSAIALKAVVGHRMVGAVRACPESGVLHIGRLTVAPDWQGQGVGSRLLAVVESRGVGVAKWASLFTGHLSLANLAMYGRRGYIEYRREPLRPGIELVHLHKPLPGTPRLGGG